MKQRQFIHDFIDKSRPRFNEKLFKRSDDDLINAIRNVIYSCERDSVFTIKVLDFQVIDDYDTINHILWEYEDSIVNKSKSTAKPKKETKKKTTKKNKKINTYDYINLKDTAMKLIQVDYYLKTTYCPNTAKPADTETTLRVYIAIPRIVNKFYYRINGVTYSAMYQIVDASTYNNTESKNAKSQSNTFGTIFNVIRVGKIVKELKDCSGNLIPCTYFIVNMFNKSVYLIKYILAKMGLQNTLSFLGIPGLYVYEYDDIDIDLEKNYVFPVKNKYIIVIDKMIYDSILVAQSLVYTIHDTLSINITKSNYNDIFTHRFWIEKLGAEFTSKDIGHYEKGLSVLDSCDFVYDKYKKQDLRLPMEDKETIFNVFRWIVYEFNALRQKDNLDITTKKVSCVDYNAALYASKIAFGIYRASDKVDKVTIKDLVKALRTNPMYLINAIANCQLVNYKNSANDLDSIVALKYTFKGPLGIGEKSNAIPASYRNIHVSHLGRLDIDSSSNSDPGISGMLCPMAKIYDNHFSEYQEPNTWRSELAKVIDMYNTMNSRVEMCRIIRDNDLNSVNSEVLNECASIGKGLVDIALTVDDSSEYINGYDIFGDGTMIYENGEIIL